MIIGGIHPVSEALAKGIPITCVWIDQQRRGRAVEAIKELCRQRNIPFQFVPAASLDRRSGLPNHQGICAETAPVRFHSLEDLLEMDAGCFLLLLDGVEDPGNLGAIMRTAAAAGVDGVILSRHQSAPVNETVWKTSAGMVTRLAIALCSSLGQVIERLKKTGYWTIGMDARAGQSLYQFSFPERTALVMGGEHRGLSRLVKERCDHLVSIPHRGEVESLNVSAAAAIALFEIVRQRFS